MSLPLLLGGCGEKSSSEGSESTGENPTAPSEEVKPVEEKEQKVKPEEPVAETKPVEPWQEVKDEVKSEEPLAATKPELKGVNENELEERESIFYLKGSDTPYTGKYYSLHPNGQKEVEGHYKDGKTHGPMVFWHKNGQKGWDCLLYTSDAADE